MEFSMKDFWNLIRKAKEHSKNSQNSEKELAIIMKC